MKVFESTVVDHKRQQMVVRELSAAVKLVHPCIVPTVGFLLPPSAGGSDDQAQLPILITKYCANGTLKAAIAQLQAGHPPDGFSRNRIAITLYGVAHAMAAVHARNFIHRDIKPDNILFDDDWHPYLADFGLARFTSPDDLEKTAAGTPIYMAPEIADERYTDSIDVFAFGVTVYMALKSSPAHILDNKGKDMEVRSMATIWRSYANGLRWKDDPLIPRNYWALIEECWRGEPNDRPRFSEIIERMESEEFALGDPREYIAFIRSLEPRRATAPLAPRPDLAASQAPAAGKKRFDFTRSSGSIPRKG
jgi:serine/threonine protein kinase